MYARTSYSFCSPKLLCSLKRSWEEEIETLMSKNSSAWGREGGVEFQGAFFEILPCLWLFLKCKYFIWESQLTDSLLLTKVSAQIPFSEKERDRTWARERKKEKKDGGWRLFQNRYLLKGKDERGLDQVGAGQASTRKGLPAWRHSEA